MIPLPTFKDKRGTLSAAETGLDLTFPVKRVFWIYDMKQRRGGHAHRTCKQVMVAVAGEVSVTTWQGKYPKQTTILDRPNQGLVVPPGLFTAYSGTPGSVLLVLCSDLYDAEDYMTEGSPV